nr:2809_t:CDS:2 [Entrophospora candida]
MNNAFAGIKPEKREDLCGHDLKRLHWSPNLEWKKMMISAWFDQRPGHVIPDVRLWQLREKQ